MLSPASVKDNVKPYCQFVNVECCGMATQEGKAGVGSATVLLENPVGEYKLTADELHEQVCIGL